MMNLKDVTCLVYDHGLYVELALRLARDYGKVYYYSPAGQICSTIQEHCVGDGFETIERVDSIWDVADGTDLFVFPDLGDAALQRQLESQGKRVWGSRGGDGLELRRAGFKEVMKQLGMEVGPYKIVTGLGNLRAYLLMNDDKFIKISRYRGNMETWHHVNYELSKGKLDDLSIQFGPLQDSVKFIVEDPLDTDIEVGWDGYVIDGKFSTFAMQGYEAKDRGLISSVQETDDMPEEVREINEKLSGIMKEAKYRNFFSTEIRVADGKPYLIDPCARVPSPAGEIQYEIWDNLAEIIWHGSNGEMVDPKPAAKFGVEVIMEHKGKEDQWRVLQIPDDIKRWVKLFGACKHGDLYCIPPMAHLSDSIGVVVGLGNTIEGAISEVRDIADALKYQPVTIDMSAIMDTLRVITEAEDKGMEFTDQEVPEPESVIQ